MDEIVGVARDMRAKSRKRSEAFSISELPMGGVYPREDRPKPAPYRDVWASAKRTW
jgi:hypothetical protein